MDKLLILDTQRSLEKFNYPNPLAISKEIIDFTKGDTKKISLILKRIQKDEPWEYIRGWTYFCGYKFFLSRNVLIPRIETEELVNIVSKYIRKKKGQLQIIEIGTGSGCIAISLSKNFNLPIYAVDISKKALDIARKNIKFHNCKNIKLIKADLLNFKLDNKKPTIIVANLPYIPSEKIKSLQDSVRKYEPIIALDGGNSGVKYYKKLFEEIKSKNINLKYCIFEIDQENKNALKNYNGTFIKDSFGRIRFLSIPPSLLK